MNNLTLEQRADMYASDICAEYWESLTYLEQLDPTEDQAEAELYQEAYEEYMLKYGQQ